MHCACRTKSLKIFVQSITELRVADPTILRSVQLNRLGSPIAFRRASPHYPTRLFSSSTAIYYPTQKWSDNADDEVLASKYGEGQSHAAARTATDTKEQPPLIPSASSNDLTAAKLNGVILDYSPESIDTLAASLDRTALAGQEDTLEERSNIDLDTQYGSRPRPKPPITSSQLKRRKIIKEDKPRPRAKGGRATRGEEWQIQKKALKEKFPEGWRPRKRLSPDALEGIRALHSQFPEQYPTEVLARNFEVSAEAVRRILRGKWTPTPDEETSRQERWFNRGKNIWSQMAELGTKPPRRWRREGIVREPHWNKKKGPRTEYPYMPRRDEDQPPAESAQRKLSGNLL